MREGGVSELLRQRAVGAAASGCTFQHDICGRASAWEATQMTHNLKHHSGCVNHVSFNSTGCYRYQSAFRQRSDVFHPVHPAGSTLDSTHSDGYQCLLTDAQQIWHALSEFANSILLCAGELLLSGSDDMRVGIWQLGQDARLQAFLATGHTQNIFCARFMPGTGEQ